MSIAEPPGLYDDLEQQGGLVPALQAALRTLGSTLVVTGRGAARVEQTNRLSQVSSALEVRLFLLNFWDRGVVLADAKTPDLLEATRCLHAWVSGTGKISVLSIQFPMIRLRPIAEPFENDREVEWKWDHLEATTKTDMPELYPLIVAAKCRSELRILFPVTSHNVLGFSRCTGYPYTHDCPHAVPTHGQQFKVYAPGGQRLGPGDADQAVQWLIDHLPPNAGPAVKGTAEEL